MSSAGPSAALKSRASRKPSRARRRPSSGEPVEVSGCDCGTETCAHTASGAASAASASATTTVPLPRITFVRCGGQIAEFDLNREPLADDDRAVLEQRPEARAANVAQHGFILEAERI